jgi:hypothetical protein
VSESVSDHPVTDVIIEKWQAYVSLVYKGLCHTFLGAGVAPLAGADLKPPIPGHRYTYVRMINVVNYHAIR